MSLMLPANEEADASRSAVHYHPFHVPTFSVTEINGRMATEHSAWLTHDRAPAAGGGGTLIAARPRRCRDARCPCRAGMLHGKPHRRCARGTQAAPLRLQ